MNQIRPSERMIKVSEKEAKKYELKCKMSSENKPYKCVTTAFDAAGFPLTREFDWNGYWGGSPNVETLKKMNKFQKMNHFPGCWNLGRKDLLWMRVSR
jgi:tubulin polyglutamylase TTLL4